MSNMARTRTFDEDTVLGRAVETFWAKGYEGTSIEDLVEGTGLSRSSLYQTFGSKLELFRKAVALYSEERSAFMLGRLESSDATPQSIVEFFASFTALADADPERMTMGCFATNTITEIGAEDPEVRATTDEYVARLTAAFENALTRAGTNGIVEVDVTSERAALLATMALGLFVRARGGLTHQESSTLESSVRALVASW
jgi:TetR/AcrR family transcriptional regulator, transcriptional repressor for nem operon